MKILIAMLISLIISSFLIRPTENFPTTFPQFTTTDSNGKIFTEKIFEKKITAIFLWTDSEPCRKIFENLDEIIIPENFQIIGLIGKNNFDASKIKNFYKIPQLKINDDFSPILKKIKFVPAVIFVDENKKIISPPMMLNDSKFFVEEFNHIQNSNFFIKHYRQLKNFIF